MVPLIAVIVISHLNFLLKKAHILISLGLVFNTSFNTWGLFKLFSANIN